MTDTPNAPDNRSAAEAFMELHRDGCFVMPNAWDGGSARIISGFGFPAIATTSAGLAYSRGHADAASLLPLEDVLANVEEITSATRLPVSADFENGYADSPEAVAANIRRVAAMGAAGASIEDYTGDASQGLYDISLATERVVAAVEAAAQLVHPFVITARAECYLIGHDQPFTESLQRLQAFADAGAHCVYAPGVKDRDEIRAMVDDVSAPINVLVGLPGMNATVDEMTGLGVRRLSVGGSLMRATLNPLLQACADMQAGRFPFPDGAPSNAEVVRLFES